jgi:hypothetical protein
LLYGFAAAMRDCLDQSAVSVAAQECEASKSTPNSSPLLFCLNLLLIEVGSQLARIHRSLALVGPQPISRHRQCLLGRCLTGVLGGLSFHFDLHLVLYACQVQVGQVLQLLQVAELFG